MNRNTLRDFTLVELLVVLVIVATVAAIAMPATSGLMNNYALTNDQARVLATLSQARALAIRHRICYSVVFNNFDPDRTVTYDGTRAETEQFGSRSWYAIMQHPATGTDKWHPSAGGDLWEDKTSATPPPTFTIDRNATGGGNTLADYANDFMMNQIGPRREFQPGVRWGVFRMDPEATTPERRWYTVGDAYASGVKDPNPSSTTEMDVFNHLADGFALNRIKFGPDGRVVRVDYAKEVRMNGSGDLLVTLEAPPDLYYDYTKAGADVTGANGEKHNPPSKTGDQFTSAKVNANPFLVTWTHDDANGNRRTASPYVVMCLSRGNAIRDGNFLVSSGSMVGIGINVATGIATVNPPSDSSFPNGARSSREWVPFD